MLYLNCRHMFRNDIFQGAGGSKEQVLWCHRCGAINGQDGVGWRQPKATESEILGNGTLEDPLIDLELWDYSRAKGASHDDGSIRGAAAMLARK